MRKIMFALLSVCAAVTLLASERPFMRLANGTILRNVKVSRVNHRGICFVHSAGFTTVKPKELSKEDQKLYAAEIKKYNADLKKENLRLRNVRNRHNAERRKQREKIAAKRKALQDMFDEELAAVREQGVEFYYTGCLRLERRWRGKSVNRSELMKMKKEGWEQKITKPVITDKNRLAYVLLLDKILLRYRYAVANAPKLVPAHNRLIKELSEHWNKLTVDETIIFFWQRSKLTMFYDNALEYMEVSEKNETRNTGKELRKILADEKALHTKIIYRFGLNIKDVAAMSPATADVKAVTGALQTKLLCPECKGRGLVETSQEASAPEPAPEAEGEEGGEKKPAKAKAVGAPKIDLAYSDKTKEIKAEPCMTCRSMGAILPNDESGK